MNKIAKAIRVLTIPPFMVTALLTVLYFNNDVFPTLLDYFLALVFLAVVPVLAYPVQKMIPRLSAGGRKAQRNLAFVFSFIGYSAAVVCSILRGAVPNLLYISAVYLLSVVFLTLVNCLTPWHASGHACSIAGPLFLISFFQGWVAIAAGALIYAASLWASVYMKRHTVREFVLGSLCSMLSAVVMYVFIHPIF